MGKKTKRLNLNKQTVRNLKTNIKAGNDTDPNSEKCQQAPTEGPECNGTGRCYGGTIV